MIRTLRLNTLKLRCRSCGRKTIHIIPFKGYRFVQSYDGTTYTFRQAICSICGAERFVGFVEKTEETKDFTEDGSLEN